jgi:hypothetical protein
VAGIGGRSVRTRGDLSLRPPDPSVALRDFGLLCNRPVFWYEVTDDTSCGLSCSTPRNTPDRLSADPQVPLHIPQNLPTWFSGWTPKYIQVYIKTSGRPVFCVENLEIPALSTPSQPLISDVRVVPSSGVMTQRSLTQSRQYPSAEQQNLAESKTNHIRLAIPAAERRLQTMTSWLPMIMFSET